MPDIMHQIILKPGKEEAVRRFHPWIFSGAIQRIQGKVADGDTVEVLSSKGEFLASGHFQEGGSISVRILSFDKAPLGPEFWEEKFRLAKSYRSTLGLLTDPQTNCYRLIHGEGDGLPGLIVDVYARTAVVQCHSIGMHRSIPLIVQALLAVCQGELDAVYDKSKETLPDRYAAGVGNSYLHGNSGPGWVLENGHEFFIDWEKGQKTGFFLDQRENRKLLAQFAPGKTVLNAFCYSGAFSVYALRAGAALVHSVDASAKALDWTRQNLLRNDFDPGVHTPVEADVLKYLKEASDYDLVIIDPPAFAKNISRRHSAVQGYKRLNAAALLKVKPGGLLFTFSCSQVVDRQLFYDTVVAAAIEAGRKVRVAFQLSQAPDHPVNLFHPESSYLKGLVLEVV
ncbi:MAG: hypothetical protein RI973_1866 [Bacteroidota bacterium]|jgi:23S rRNA (cytosine1962-C5)-methyltransferase